MFSVTPADAHLAVVSTVTVLAQAEVEPPQGPEFGKASPIGIPVVLLLLIVTVLLIWNMNTRIKKLPESFDEANPEPDQLADEGTDRSGVVSPEAEDRDEPSAQDDSSSGAPS